MHKRLIMQIMRTIMTVIVVSTMAVMIFSLRGELNEAKARLRTANDQDSGVYVLCRFDLKPDADIAGYVAKTLAVVPTVRAEDGCLRYDYYFSEADENELLLIEAWETKRHQEIHIEQPHMAKLRALKGDYVETTTLGEFEVK